MATLQKTIQIDASSVVPQKSVQAIFSPTLTDLQKRVQRFDPLTDNAEKEFTIFSAPQLTDSLAEYYLQIFRPTKRTLKNAFSVLTP